MFFVYINLESRQKKNKHMINLLTKLKLNFERFNAIRPSLNEIGLLKNLHPVVNQLINSENEYKRLRGIGTIGCYLSHLNVLKKYKSINSKYLIILEDDVYFNSESIRKLNEIIEYLDNNEDWDILRLIWNHHTKHLKYTNKSFENIKLLKFDSVHKQSIFKLKNSKQKINQCSGGTHFQIINTKKINKIIDYLEKELIFDIDAAISTNLLNVFAIATYDLNVKWNIFNITDIPKK